MNFVARVVAALAASGAVGADCGGPCTNPNLPVAMTEARAKRLAPQVDTGLAVSTTHVYGDCSAENVPDPDACGDPIRCARRRGPYWVYVVSGNANLPRSEACAQGYPATEIKVVSGGQASPEGELVLALPPGRYNVFFSVDGVCAYCGLSDGGQCWVDVLAGQITARDLVWDQAFR